MLDQLEPLLRAFWFVAIPASLLFVLQTIMTFLGTDVSDGGEADLSGHTGGIDTPFELFSLRNLINFLLGFSWSGISFYHHITHKAILVVVALGVGILFVNLFFLLIGQLVKLAEDNSFQIASTLHLEGEVYLSIPENKQGIGKILISVKGSVRELEAMTEGPKIPTGSRIRVVAIENNNLLIVETI